MTGPLHRLGPAALAGSVLLSAAGQLGMKAGMQELQRVLAAQASLLDLGAMQSPLVWTIAGLAAYACSLALWLVVLVRYPLSLAYPLLGLSYVLVYVGATFWPRLAEPATLARTLGTLLILVGVAVVSYRTDHPPQRPRTNETAER